jgi:hypothetical protein
MKSEEKNRVLYELSDSKVRELKALNEAITALLNNPEAKCPVIGYDGSDWKFLPRRWTDFSIKSGGSWSNSAVTSSIGDGVVKKIGGNDYYVFLDATIDPKASERLQNPLQTWEPATATIDFSSGNVLVVGTEKQAYIKDVPGGTNSYWQILDHINDELFSNDAGLYVVKLAAEKLGETDRGVYPPERKVPTVKNDQAMVSLVGAAFHGGAYGNLVAFEAVGHKVSIESILATVRQGKKVYFENGMNGMCAMPVRSSKSVSKNIDNINMVNTFTAVNAAMPGGFRFKDEEAYVLCYETDAEKINIEKMNGFIAKLEECLAYPIRREWGKVLYDAAKRSNFVVDLTCVGSITGGIAILLEKDWENLLSNLLKAGYIKIEGV